jgi:uncharacterized protein YgiM (DUF1202 family)
MKKILVSLMAVMLLVGFVPTTTVEASEVETSEVENLAENDRATWTVTITNNNVNLRTGPGTNFTSLGQVHEGNRGVQLSSQRGSDGFTWYQVRMTTGPNAGRTGWVSSLYSISHW